MCGGGGQYPPHKDLINTLCVFLVDLKIRAGLNICTLKTYSQDA